MQETSHTPTFAGLPLDCVRLMGIVNVTPDSFSDGGRFFTPAAAIAQAVVSDRFVEPVVIQRGTELRLETETGTGGVFRTQRDLRVLPIYLESTEVRPRGRGGHRMIVRFESRFARKDPVEVVSLYVRHLDSYRTSLAVFHALRKSLQDVAQFYFTDLPDSYAIAAE